MTVTQALVPLIERYSLQKKEVFAIEGTTDKADCALYVSDICYTTY